jgi:ABC-type Mn2+/Zn2+ transport system ATPase subunit
VQRVRVSDPAVVLEIEHLSVDLAHHRAIEDISFAVRDGERVALVGPNGAGKTTLLRAIAGALAPAAGRVVVHDHEPGRSCVAYVPQTSEVDWRFPLTAADVVMMGRAGLIGLGRRPDAGDRDRVAESLATVGLADLADRPIKELSGGQKQRMFIARALAQEADLCLLDEPLAALDVMSAQEVLETLYALSEQGVTVLAATHALDHAASQFDKVLLLNKRLVAYGRPGAVFRVENLQAAYGGHVHVVETGDGHLIIGGTWCPVEVDA